MASVGVYSASYGIGSIVSLFYGSLSIILLPTLSRLYEANKIEEIKTHLKYLSKVYLMLTIPSAFGLTVLSKSLLITLTTSEFISGFVIIPIIALATIFFNFGSIIGSILMLYKRTKMIGLIAIVSALINIILNIILVPLIGISGAAIATLITFAFFMATNIKLCFKELSYEIDFRFISKSVVASIPMAFVVWKLNPYGAVSILIAVGIATAIYFGVLILFRGFTKDEYEFLRGLFKI
jgi:O-antigen/teichoic acid export membrane protein